MTDMGSYFLIRSLKAWILASFEFGFRFISFNRAISFRLCEIAVGCIYDGTY